MFWVEPLALWAEEFGITGIGIDISEDFCDRARKKLATKGLSDQIEIVCSPATDYVFEEGVFDAATCIGSTFVYGGYQQTIQAMKRAVHQSGRLGIGEPHWLSTQIRPEYAQKQTTTHTEAELARFTRDEGFELEYIIHSQDDWDRYYSDHWYALINWLEENPTHPDYEQVFKHFRTDQDDYLQFQRCMAGRSRAPTRSPASGATTRCRPRATTERPGLDCYCGRRGCIETFLSGPGLARDHEAAGGGRLDPAEIVTRTESGDAVAAATLARYEDRLARALATVINLLDPHVIVLGGGLSNVARLYRNVPALWGAHVFSDRVDTRLVPPQHGDSSGVRGAAWLWQAPE